MALRDTIKELCKKKGVTMAEAERDLGFAKGYLSKLDKSSPSSERIKVIAEYLGVSPSMLLLRNYIDEKIEEISEGHYVNPGAAKAAQEAFDNPDMKALFDAARGASAEDIRAACAVLLALKAKNGGNNQE
jgi:transcriptional regulator with XRE-family HTH domain